MKITHIITGLDDGGAEAVLHRLVTSDRSGARHIVVSLGDGGRYAPLLQSASVPVHTLGMPRGRLTMGGLMRLYRLLRRERPDIVQTWMVHANLVGGIIARLAGCHRVFWGIHHTDLARGSLRSSARKAEWLCARLSGFVPRGIVACAERARQVSVASGYAPNKISVIPNGYDLSQFRPDPDARQAVRRELDIGDDIALIGLVGRWDPLKDHANLLRAFAQVRLTYPQCRLLLVGSGCDSGNRELAQLIADLELGGTVHLLGPRTDIPAVMNALDLHVLPSFSEAFPNVLCEAMACGTPCVSTDVGDAAAILGSTGWIVPPRDFIALASAIINAITERTCPSWQNRKGKARDRIVENFSIHAMVEHYKTLWCQSVSPRVPMTCNQQPKTLL